MNGYRTLQIMLQVDDVGDENVDTQPDVKSEPPPPVRMIQWQRLIQLQRLNRPSLSYESCSRVNRPRIVALVEINVNWHSSNGITNRKTYVIASYCHHIYAVLY